MPQTAREVTALGGPSSAPARKSMTITPDDASDLPFVARVLECTGAGTIAYVAVDDDDAVIRTRTLALGDLIDWVLIRRVRATGTTATVIGWYGG